MGRRRRIDLLTTCRWEQVGRTDRPLNPQEADCPDAVLSHSLFAGSFTTPVTEPVSSVV